MHKFQDILKRAQQLQEEAIKEYKQTTPLDFFTSYKEQLKQSKLLKNNDARYKVLYIIQQLDSETKSKYDSIIKEILYDLSSIAIGF
jgi:hypothetical protein